jgi:hypothetical protein
MTTVKEKNVDLQAMNLQEMRIINGGDSIGPAQPKDGLIHNPNGTVLYTGSNGLVYFGVAIYNAGVYIYNWF